MTSAAAAPATTRYEVVIGIDPNTGQPVGTGTGTGTQSSPAPGSGSNLGFGSPGGRTPLLGGAVQ